MSAMTLEAAKLFLAAFDQSSIDVWIRALRAAEGIEDKKTKLGAAVGHLREVWYHDGTAPKRKLVHLAAAGLRFEIEEEENRANLQTKSHSRRKRY